MKRSGLRQRRRRVLVRIRKGQSLNEYMLAVLIWLVPKCGKKKEKLVAISYMSRSLMER